MKAYFWIYKTIVYCGLISVALSCSSEKQKPQTVIPLFHNLGTISLTLPPKFDTIYRWHQYSDCSCCGRQKIRIAHSKYSLPKETVFGYRYLPDSLYQFTIEQQEFPNCSMTSDKAISQQEFISKIKSYEEIASSRRDTSFQWIDKKLTSINYRTFAIFSIQSQSKAKKYTRVEASTIFRNQYIEIKCLCFAKNCDDFVREVNTIIASIRLFPPPYKD